MKESGSIDTYNFLVDNGRPSEIEHLTVHNATNDVDSIPSGLFTAFLNLRTFQMRTNLTELAPDDFSNALNLNSLRLGDNKLRIVRNNVFSPRAKQSEISAANIYPLHKLKSLDLQSNEIAEIESNSFDGLDRLFFLDLSHNQLTIIRRHTFTALPLLQRINLSNNKIGKIEDGALDLSSLKWLYLDGNKLKTLSDDVFEQLPKIDLLVLNQNELERIGCSLYGLSKIKEIAMNDNRIEDIDLAAFARMSSLRKLTLARSGFTFAMTEFEDDGQVWNSSLLSLGIDDNNLTDASELIKLKVFPKLKELSLNGNPYSNLEVGGNQTLRDILPELIKLNLLRTNIGSRDVQSIAHKLRVIVQYLGRF